jgi:hypothetical protein
MNSLENYFDESLVNSWEHIVDCFESLDYSTKKIAEYIKNFDEITTAGIHLSALNKGNKKMADRIDKAMEINKENRINAFKEVVANGTEQEYLSKMTWIEKLSLQCDMDLSSVRLNNKPRLTEKEKNYVNILENSIAEDIKNIALSEGFSSVEEWRHHNWEVDKSRLLRPNNTRVFFRR